MRSEPTDDVLGSGLGAAEDRQTGLVDELRAAADRLHRLQRLSTQLTRARDVDDVVAAVMDHLDAPVGASARALWLQAAGADHLTLVAQIGLKPEAVQLFDRIDRESSLPGAIAVRERRTIVSSSTSDTTERFPELHDAPRTAEGFLAVPLIADEEALGVLAFGFDGALDDADIVFLEAAGGHIAQTLERVRLDHVLRRRAADAAFLAEVAQAAISAGDHGSLMRDVARAVLPRLGTWSSLHFVPTPGAGIETVVVHADPARDEWATRVANLFPYDRSGTRGVASVLRSGQTEHVDAIDDASLSDAAARLEGDPDANRRHLDRLRIHSVITVPIITKGRVIGALQAVRSGDDPAHSRDDVVLAETVASRIGDALENRWLTDQHHHISATLQRAFLPPVLPQIEGLEIATAYWPAGAASDVGGDFYDLFRIDDDRWAVVIGDACGTGADAAAVAAIARHTIRAAARHGFDHRTVIEWVNQAIRYSDRDLFATLCYATLDSTAPHRVEVASAGHPLPVAITADGATSVGRPGTLVGVFADVDVHVVHADLGPGDAIVFWTDGVTDLPPPYGRTAEDLSALLSSTHDAPASHVIDVIRRDLDDRVSDVQREDDVALLVLRRPSA
jgi:GAF domain-containing protein